MKRLVIVGLLLMVVGLAGCGNPLMDEWADRGIVGVNHGKTNIDEYRDELVDVLRDRRDRDIDAIFADILTIGTGKVDGVVIDEAWLETHKAALKLILKLDEADRDTLDEATKKALSNLDQVIECFEQIKRLRRSWNRLDNLQSQVDRLATMITQLVNKGD